MQLRDESPADAAAIENLTIAAFRTAPYSAHTEQFIVRDLRAAGQLTVSLVAEDEGRIVGHVAVSPVKMSDGATGWYGLGPISVAPGRQRQGIGSQLMARALQALRERGAAGCVLLGDPGYYSRFGFKAGLGPVLPGVPADHFQTLSFGGPVPQAEASYHEAFSARE